MHRNRHRGSLYARMMREEVKRMVIYSWKRRQEGNTDNITSNVSFPFILLLNTSGHPCIRMVNEENKEIGWPFTAFSVTFLSLSYETVQKQYELQ